MSAVCSICDCPAPDGLAMHRRCLHCFHAACLQNLVANSGHCPVPKCASGEPVRDDEIQVLIVDPPQQYNNNGGGTEQQPNSTTGGNAARVREVLGAVMQRLREIHNVNDQDQAQVEQVNEAFELILSEKRRGGNGGAANAGGNETGWDKLMRIVQSKEVKIVALVAIFVCTCVFFWAIVGPGGLFASQAGELVSGILATLRAIAPEILATLAATGSFLFSMFRSKKSLD